MRTFIKLSLLGTLLALDESERESAGYKAIEVTKRILDLQKLDPETLSSNGIELINSLLAKERYRTEELLVNEELSDYIRFLVIESGKDNYEDTLSIANAITRINNKGNFVDQPFGLSVLQTFGQQAGEALIDELSSEPFSILNYELQLRRLEFVDNILTLLDSFSYNLVSAITGVEEFPTTPDFVPAYEESELVDGNNCLGVGGCECGCESASDDFSDEFSLTLIQGMEDYRAGKETDATRYLAGVMLANNIRTGLTVDSLTGGYKLTNESVTGNEAITFDSIKQLGNKAYDQLLSFIKTLKESFKNKNFDERRAKIAKHAEQNKEALSKMEAGKMKVNDKASAGLSELMKASGADESVVSSLSGVRTKENAMAGIDLLLKEADKIVAEGKTVESALNDAEKAVNDIKTSSSAATSGKEENKEETAVKKESVDDAIKLAKEKVAEAKKKVSELTKKLAAYEKAIKGLSPAIFIKEEENKDE